MDRGVLALDQGTTSSRAILFDEAGKPRYQQGKEFAQIYPRPGWVEHDPEAIWASQLEMAQAVLQDAGQSADGIAAIGITNQRETTVIWDRQTGKPIYNAIVWQDRRTADTCDRLRADGHEGLIRANTGLLIDPYFSATKIRWILDRVDGAQERAERGELAFGTIDSFLIWRLTGGKVHVTDASNASRTMLFNIRTLDWDEDILRLLNIPRSLLPEVVGCSQVYGHTDKALFGKEIPVAGCAGDQQAATFGQTCFAAGNAKQTYGTGSFLLMNVGDRPQESHSGLLSTVAWVIDGTPTYALEGSIFVTGAAVQWLRDGLQIIEHARETQALAESIATTGEVYVVPAFAGLGAPYWNAYARGGIFGLTRGTGREEIARATLEAVAYQTRDVLDAIRNDTGMDVSELRVDGGMVANDFLMQFQADIIDTPVVRPAVPETTALGAAYLAGLAVGFWDDLDAIRATWHEDRRFAPKMSAADRDSAYRGWQRAVQASIVWANDRD